MEEEGIRKLGVRVALPRPFCWSVPTTNLGCDAMQHPLVRAGYNLYCNDAVCTGTRRPLLHRGLLHRGPLHRGLLHCGLLHLCTAAGGCRRTLLRRTALPLAHLVARAGGAEDESR